MTNAMAPDTVFHLFLMDSSLLSGTGCLASFREGRGACKHPGGHPARVALTPWHSPGYPVSTRTSEC